MKAKDILLNDGFADGLEAQGMLQGITATVSAGSFRTYGIHNLQKRQTWYVHYVPDTTTCIYDGND